MAQELHKYWPAKVEAKGLPNMKSINSVLAVLAFTGWASNASAIPISSADIVTVDGVEWAQVDLFSNLSWEDMSVVCPGGVCGPGTLNGYDMDGMVWATLADVYSLFNYYIGSDVLEVGGDSFYSEPDSTWAPLFLSEWRATITSNDPDWQGVDGFVSTSSGAIYAFSASLVDRDGATDNAIGSILPKADAHPTLGAFFYRASSGGGVSAPATLTLFSLALAVLGWARHKTA